MRAAWDRDLPQASGYTLQTAGTQKTNLGQAFAVSLEKCIENRSHGCARAPRPREVLGWNIGRKRSMADS